MQELIQRLERASSFNRVLDGDIALYLGWTYEKMKGDAKPYWRKPSAKEYWERERSGPPHFTASVDAALTLVPALCWARVQTETRDAPPIAWASNETDDELSFEGIGANPAIALCIAALKARSSDAAMTAQPDLTHSTPS